MERREQVIHKAVVEHIKLRGVAGLVWWHTPSGAFYGGKRQGAIMKSLGARAGVSDILLFHDHRLYCLEIKAQGGRASEEQLAFIADIDRAGAFTALATGLDACLATLEAWKLIKPNVTMRGIVDRLESA